MKSWVLGVIEWIVSSHLYLFLSSIVCLSKIGIFFHPSLFWFFIMATKRDDSLPFMSVWADEKIILIRVTWWDIFFKDKKLWEYVTWTYVISKSTNQNYNTNIITLINNSIENLIGIQSTEYKTTKEVWDHLWRLHTKLNFVK